MKYSDLVDVYEKLEATSKKLEKTDLVAKLLERLDEDELAIVVPLLQGKIYHESEEMEVGVANKMVISSLEKLGFSKKEILEVMKDTGDLGLTAEILVKKKRQMSLFKETLSAEKVYSSMRELATHTGKSSQLRKMNVLIELLNFSEPKEAKYIIRTVLEELRLGVAEGILRDAVAKAYGISPDIVESA
ncbi:MAG: ATP-dependent DNA ligase, partial [Candidatus Aenigmatarchaeota archaeon]